MPYINLKQKILRDLHEYDGAQDNFTREEICKEHFEWIKANVSLTPGDLQKIEEFEVN